MGGPLSVARAVTDPRIMRNEPSQRRVHEPSARSDVAPRQAGDTASTVPCPRTAQSNPRGAEARAALSQARGPPGPASPTLRPLGRQPRRRNPTLAGFLLHLHLIADLRTRQGALFLPMLGTKRRWKRPTNRDEGTQPVVGEERAINAPHPATPASPFCCPGRVYLEHHQKQHFEHNQHLEGHNENSNATHSRGAGSLGITLAGFVAVLVL